MSMADDSTGTPTKPDKGGGGFSTVLMVACVVVALAVAAFFGYRWYKNRKKKDDSGHDDRGSNWALQKNVTRGRAPSKDETDKATRESSGKDCSDKCFSTDKKSTYALYNPSQSLCICRESDPSHLQLDVCYLPAKSSSEWEVWGSSDIPQCADPKDIMTINGAQRGAFKPADKYVPLTPLEVQTGLTAEQCMVEVALRNQDPDPQHSSQTGFFGNYYNNTCYLGSNDEGTFYKSSCWTENKDNVLFYDESQWNKSPATECHHSIACELPPKAVPPGRLLNATVAPEPSNALACMAYCGKAHPVSVENDSNCSKMMIQGASMWLPNGEAQKQCVCYDWYRDHYTGEGYYNSAHEDNDTWLIPTEFRDGAVFQIDTDFSSGYCDGKSSLEKVASSKNMTDPGYCRCLTSSYSQCLNSSDKRTASCTTGAEPVVLQNPTSGSEKAFCKCLWVSDQDAKDMNTRYRGQFPANVWPYSSDQSTAYPDACGGTGVGQMMNSFVPYAKYMCDMFINGQSYIEDSRYGNMPFVKDAQIGQSCFSEGDEPGTNCGPGLKCNMSDAHPECAGCVSE